jgi:hypothetical protein
MLFDETGTALAKKCGGGMMAKKAKKRKAAKRELINTGSDKRFVRRGTKGRFKESDKVSRSLARDVKKKAKKKAKKGQGDRGDR